MKKIINLQEYIIAGLTIIIGLLMLTDVFNFQRLEFSQTQIGIANVISVILFFGICLLKNYNKVKMITILNRFNKQTFVIISTYILTAIFFFLIFIINGTLIPIMGVIIILLEVFLLITNIYMNETSKVSRSILNLVIAKEFHFDVLVFVLLLDGLPFTLINIPIKEILAITYIMLQVNLVYSYFKESK